MDDVSSPVVVFAVRVPEAMARRFRSVCALAGDTPARALRRFVADFTARGPEQLDLIDAIRSAETAIGLLPAAYASDDEVAASGTVAAVVALAAVELLGSAGAGLASVEPSPPASPAARSRGRSARPSRARKPAA